MTEVTLGESNWEEEVIKSDIPVMIDFWATWCAPCRMVSPMVEEFSKNQIKEKLSLKDRGLLIYLSGKEQS